MNNLVVLKALAVAILVGTILLVINQYDALFGKESMRMNPAILTYIVPFIVFLCGHLSKSREWTIQTGSHRDARILHD